MLRKIIEIFNMSFKIASDMNNLEFKFLKLKIAIIFKMNNFKKGLLNYITSDYNI